MNYLQSIHTKNSFDRKVITPTFPKPDLFSNVRSYSIVLLLHYKLY